MSQCIVLHHGFSVSVFTGGRPKSHRKSSSAFCYLIQTQIAVLFPLATACVLLWVSVTLMSKASSWFMTGS